MNNPWIEKYRPLELKDIILPSGIRNQLKNIVINGCMPNMIITGNTGIGKTTTVLCVAKQLLGDKLEDGFKELNASDERGIKVVDVLTQFCKKKLTNSKGESIKKIILLDEADNMMDKQQRLIGGLLKEFKKTVAFIFTCNSSTKIIEEIQSECIILGYTRLNKDLVIGLLETICGNENVPYDIGGLTSLASISQGDMRNAINNLYKTFCAKNKVSLKNVHSVCDLPDPEIIGDIVVKILKKPPVFREILQDIDILFGKGYLINDILIGLTEFIKSDDKILNEEHKIKIMNEISKTQNIVSNNVDSRMQLYATLGRIVKNIN